MILVAGATGTIGRELVLELKSRRAPVRALTRDPERARLRIGPVDFAVGSVARPETVARALEGARAAFLLSPDDPDALSWETAFVRAARAAGVERLVLVSELGAALDAPFAAGRRRAEAEEELARSGPKFAILRPALLYQNLFAASLTGGTLAAPLGTARFALVDARDVAAAAAAALLDGAGEGAATVLTGPAALSGAEIAAVLSEALGRRISYRDLPPELARRALLEAGLPAWRADALLERAAFLRSGRADLGGDGVRALSGREPIPLARFARDYAARLA
ncbi:MAG: NAD(P)H-binding protein [Elusimicrobia bacterium]|nr:NAD(P)H-binding protein [Elusimicrobiota bacterium]